MIVINLGNGKIVAKVLPSGDFYVEDKKILIKVVGYELDGSIAINLNGHLNFLIFNPISKEYVLTGPLKVPNLLLANHYEIVKCDKLKYIGFMIAKNGCSCLLKSALVYDGILNDDDNRFIWEIVNEKGLRDKVVFQGNRAVDVLNKYSDYKKFIVIQDERERFIKYINWTHKNKYNTFFNLSLSKT